MKKFEEKQVELMIYLNDNEIEPNEVISSIAEILGIVFISNEVGWDIEEYYHC